MTALLILLVLFSIIPGFVASARGHRQAFQIWLLCLFLGWSLIGWVVALVWACASERPEMIVVRAVPEAPRSSDSIAREIERFARLRDSGVLTDEEFQAKKRQLAGPPTAERHDPSPDDRG